MTSSGALWPDFCYATYTPRGATAVVVSPSGARNRDRAVKQPHRIRRTDSSNPGRQHDRPGVLAAEVIGVDAMADPSSAGTASDQSPPTPSGRRARRVARLHRRARARRFLGGDETQPIVLGLVGATAGARRSRCAAAGKAPDTLRVEAGRELVIECGEAKISLRKDGRVEIRGTHLISRSSGPNKIKGGSVFIN